ncbi:MAG: hypothetical protein CVV27_16430 [Candidatus Melainabacteria bacterium HGW-Melainabacteria-1]|nr:MAG: hypothetical protein CVV27_16430 [Candidatus Melainabacteria bacterium HGW-Melainabacteria-1]
MAGTAPAWAGSGLGISLENLFVPMGKQVERLPLRDPNAQPTTGASPVAAPVRGIGPGRETTEWVGLTGFVDLNRNWRLLGGAHTTLLGEGPLFKFDGALAFVFEMPSNVPLQPYLFLGASPVISANPSIPTFGLNLHSGMGVDVIWNNTLYTQVRANLYLLSIYGESANQNLNLQWLPASFSLSAGMGYLF